MHIQHIPLSFSLCVLCLFFSAASLLRAAEPAAPQLLMWVKAEDLAARLQDGDRVGLWLDVSGQGNHLKSSAAARPTFKADGLGAGKPAVIFAGDAKAEPKVEEYFNLPFQLETRGTTIFVVGTNLNRSGWYITAMGRAFSLEVNNNQIFWMHSRVGLAKSAYDVSELQLVTLTAGVDPEMNVGRLGFFANGQLVKNLEKKDPLPYGITYFQPRIGSTGSRYDSPHNGAIAEVLVYNYRLSDEDRAAVERYLLAKYALAATDNAPRQPIGAPGPAPKLPEVKNQPAQEGLQVWMKADEITGITSGIPVASIPNMAGEKKPLTSQDDQGPLWFREALNGRPALRLKSNTLQLPLEKASWPEMTVLAVGRNLAWGAIFESASEQKGALLLGPKALLVGTQMGYEKLYPLRTGFPLASNSEVPGAIGVTIGNVAGQQYKYMSLYGNGRLQRRIEDKTYTGGVVIDNAKVGVHSRYNARFNGLIAEVLVYNRALSEAEMTQAFAYFAEKYGVEIPTPEVAEKGINARSRWGASLPAIPNSLSWAGNTFNGVETWVQSGVADIAVKADGTVAVTCDWDERAKNIGFYKDGYALPKPMSSHASRSIAWDGTYFYRAYRTWSAPFTVQLRRLTAELADAPWPDTKTTGWPTWMDDPKKEGYQGTELIYGLAVGNGEVYAGQYNGVVKVFDAATGKETRSFNTHSKLTRLAVDKKGLLWIGGNPGSIWQYNVDGTPTGVKIDDLRAGALHVDANGRLFVAENGARQQVIVFDISGNEPKELFTVGELGGIRAGVRPGAIVPERLSNPCGVGTDTAGNIYIGQDRSTRAYSPDGKKMLWQVYCAEFTTSGDIDPDSDGHDLYTPRFRYRFEPGQPGGSEWAWAGTTIAPGDKFPVATGFVRRLAGRLYHFTVDTNGQIVIRKQQENQEYLAPCTYIHHTFTPWGAAPAGLPRDKALFIWVDRNGNAQPEEDEVTAPTKGTITAQYHWGLYVDARGDLWFPENREGVRYLPLKEILPNGTLVYDYDSEKWFPRPAEMIEVYRSFYDTETDAMYLMGTTWDDPLNSGMPHIQMRGIGRDILRYDNWTKPERTLRWRTRVPDTVNILSADVTFKSQLFFAADIETAGSFCFDTETGKLLGFLEVDHTKIGRVGWIDIRSAIHAFTRKNGETLLISENCVSQMVIVYRIPPRKEWPEELR